MNNKQRTEINTLTEDEIMDEDYFDLGEFKVALNNVMLQFGPTNLTLKQAEHLMIPFCDAVATAADGNE